MAQKSAKTAAELESIRSAGVVVIRPMGFSWDAALVGDGPPLLNVECNQKLSEITNRLRQEFDLAD
jgi:hypothetical protein